jgi:cardiolipin synthase
MNVSPIKSFHTSTTDAWKAMLSACSHAQVSIDMEEYVFQPDEIGEKFISVFEERAKAGVKVRLLLDWWGCKRLKKHKIMQRIRNAGIEVRFFRPPSWNWLISQPRFLPRDHRKIFILDKKTAYAGGVCINDHYKKWRDTMVEVSGSLTDQLSHIFEQTWLKCIADEKKIKAHPNFTELDEFSVYANAPDSDEHYYTELLKDQLSQAEKSIKLVTPYFTPSEEFMTLLKEALKRKVSVELLLSKYSKYSTYVVGKKLCGELIKIGATVRYYEPVMLHLKTMIIDQSWCAIGSCNLDGLSIHHNQEIMIASTNADFVKELRKHYDKDIEHAVRLQYSDWQSRPYSEKIMGSLLSPTRHYL